VSGYVDLHSHYVPGIDDGVDSLEAGIDLCTGLMAIGFSTVVATPHIRTAMFENRRAGILTAHADFAKKGLGREGMPELGIAAEHFFDDIFWSLYSDGEAVPYEGGHAILVELPPRSFPIRLQDHFFQMNVGGTRPVLAHPERYNPLFRHTDALDPLIAAGALPLLDIMSLTGRYGRGPRRAAERMLEEDVYFAACSDSHRPADVAVVEKAMNLLDRQVGRAMMDELLRDNPRRILEGNLDV